jgi:hypothetical protein
MARDPVCNVMFEHLCSSHESEHCTTLYERRSRVIPRSPCQFEVRIAFALQHLGMAVVGKCVCLVSFR